MILPVSWAVLLEMFRPAFRRRSTFAVFTVLATGMVAQTGRRSVVGMLSGARMAGVLSFHAACRFFSQAVWDVDRLGLIRLWAGKGSASPVELAGELLSLIAAQFPGRQVHGVGDAAYHGKPLLVPATTWTTRLPANAALYGLAPSRTGRRGRPALKGAKLGKPAAVATDADWEKVTVVRYGRTESVYLAEVACIWYGSFGNAVGRCVLVREEDTARTYDLALFTLDAVATVAQVVQRYAVRWSIEPSNATGKQQMGVGQARNRVARAVERTVPFGMLMQSMVIVWYALHGYHPDDVAARRRAHPWYESKTEPSFEDMIVKLRRTLIAARFTVVRPGQIDPDLLRDYALACAAAAA